MRAFQRDIIELVFLEQDILALVDLVALDAVFRLDRVAGLRVHHLLADSVAGFPVNDVEPDALARGCRGVQRDGAGHQRQFEKTLPIGARRHSDTPCTQG